MMSRSSSDPQKRTLETVIVPFIRPIEPWLYDPSITEVMLLAGGRHASVVRNGRTHPQPDVTIPEPSLLVAIKNIGHSCGTDVNEARPLLDARLEDGSRVAAMIRPVAVDGPALTIRRHPYPYTVPELVANGTLTSAIADDLKAAVHARQNILVSGGTDSGKTTLLNALAAYLPADDRIILIEDTSEIAIPHEQVLRCEAQRAQPAEHPSDVRPEVSIADLVRASLRHRPDRLIVGEVRGLEAYDLLQALNTGHAGSLSTIHASSATQALTRFAHCVLTARTGLPYRAIREAIGQAIQIVVHVARDPTGIRRVTELVNVGAYSRRDDRFDLQILHVPSPHAGQAER